MKSKLSKQEIQIKIQEFFKDIKNQTPRLSQARSDSSKIQAKEVKKIKKLAMSKNISLGELRKKFCKKCLTPYKNPKIRIKNKIKSVTCGECSYVARWKLK